MAARSRGPRGHSKDDDGAQHEEAQLWAQIMPDLRSFAGAEKTQASLLERIETEESRIKTEGYIPTISELNALAELMEKYHTSINKQSDSTQSTIEKIELLSALRLATETGDREIKTQRKKRAGADTDGLSTPGGSSRNKMARSMSASAPAENGGAGKNEFYLNGDVAYRISKQKGSEAEWIQCVVVNILGDGPKRRYEVKDPIPDEKNEHSVYKTSAKDLIPVPKDNVGLPPLPPGKQVLARYPDTTAFYRAEVILTKRDGTCRLKFEGEEEVGKETDVERRWVLDVGNK